MEAQIDISLKWFVIVNPVAGSGRGLDDLPQITKLIRDNDIPYELVFSQHKYHVTELTVQAVNAGYRRIMISAATALCTRWSTVCSSSRPCRPRR